MSISNDVEDTRATSLDNIDIRARKVKLAAAIRAKQIRDERKRQSDLGEPGRLGGLIHFVRYFWHVLEPATKFVEGWVVEAVCLHLEAVTRGEIKRLLINVPPGCMKALDSDTPVMTTWGWKRHGDLRPGDFVFGPDGKPKRVLANTAPGVEPSYEVEFDDGAIVVAGKGHLWEVERDYPYGGPGSTRCRKKQVVTTPELIPSVAGRGLQRPDRIALAEPLEMPPKRLLIDPYLLGAWLGDGASLSGVIYTGDQDVEHFSKLGYIAKTYPAGGTRKQDFHRIGVDDLQVKLRVMGLLNNKHIPDDYLEASIEQRWELLRGLMDTDGCAAKEGHCSFTNKNERLSRQVETLVASLGMKPCVRSRYTVLNGKKFGPHYFVTFTAPDNAQVFNLERKQSRLRGNLNARSRGRYVRAVREVGDRVVNCISVEGELYLAGKRFVTTHNSLLVNVFWPAWEWSAADLPSTRYVTFSYAAHLTVRDNAKFRDVIQSFAFREVWGHRITLKKEGEIKPENDKTGWKFASSVGGVGTGERGNRLLADDLHSVKSSESETVRSETVRWVREGMSNRLNDMASDVIIGIGQRVHEEDASAAMLSDGDYVHLCIPMEYDPGRHCKTVIGWEDPRTEEGELCWPERFPKAVVQKLKTTLGPYAFSAQYQQAPSPRGGGIIKREWWQLWEEPAFPVCRYKWASADTAYTEKESNDPTGFTVWGLFEIQGQPNIILMDAWRKRLELHIPAKWVEEDSSVEARMNMVLRWKKAAWAEHKRSVTSGSGSPEPLIDPRLEPWASYIQGGHNQADRWPGETYAIWTLRTQPKWGLCEWISHSCRRFQVDEVVIEGKASGLSVAQELRRLNGHEGWGIRTTTPEGDKVARAYAVQPIFSAGLVWAPEREWSELVIDEVSSFPKGRYKDLTDSCLTADTGIVTTRGVVPISEVVVGDRVFTHKGRWRKVLNVGSRKSDHFYRLKAKGMEEIKITAEHPALVMRVRILQNQGVDHRKMANGMRWEPVGNLLPRKTTTRVKNGKTVNTVCDVAHDALVVPRGAFGSDGGLRSLDLMDYAVPGTLADDNYLYPARKWPHTIDHEVQSKVAATAGSGLSLTAVSKEYGISIPSVVKIYNSGYRPRYDRIPRKIDLTEDAGWAFGLFLAEGSFDERGKASWSCDEESIKRVSLWANNAFGRFSAVLRGQGCYRYCLGALAVGDLFRSFGKHAPNKVVPEWIFDANEKFIRGFVDGFAHGDGHTHKKNENHVSLTSTSQSLLWGMKLLLARLGMVAWRGTPKQAGGRKGFHGKVMNCLAAYRIDYTKEPTGFATISEDYIGTHIEYCDRVEEEVTVYNMSVEEDESYVTVGGTVHNCSQALKYIREIGLLLRPEERQFMADMSARYVPPSTPLYDV